MSSIQNTARPLFGNFLGVHKKLCFEDLQGVKKQAKKKSVRCIPQEGLHLTKIGNTVTNMFIFIQNQLTAVSGEAMNACFLTIHMSHRNK